ncbi:3-isopropylmalate dehydratase small subunit [Burkholderia metallica]|uniref:3-isopropylmalate dehydratase small subunit n=1 Tax=Burkholderia metallica TaxID=488729 RepID=UPI00157B632C|nr:3-isopropylmalate dehydratase small subunit [Burkholderia metallica]NTZ83627.1 3-isopropylmalate dehydratase small subunit [Burkholderia metallica]
MDTFTFVRGRVIPLVQPNLDTDVIIRIERLTGLPKSELGRYAFEALRYGADGEERSDCVLNQPHFRGAPILLAGANFGCGSSREGAVWALQGAGIRCVIAESFGDIFYGNCFQNGVLPIRLPVSAIKDLASRANKGEEINVDLERQTVSVEGCTAFQFDVAPMRRQMLLLGLDEIAQTRQLEPEIVAWQTDDRRRRPWVWHTSSSSDQ